MIEEFTAENPQMEPAPQAECGKCDRKEGVGMNELQNLVLDLWKPNSVRSRYSQFKPVFVRFEGVDDEREYNDICRTIAQSKDQATLIIDGNFQFQPRLDVLAQIKKEIPSVDLNHITRDFLVMFADPEVNTIYLNALNYTFQLAKRNGLLKTRKQEENFVCNQIVLSTQYLMNLPFDPDHCPKVIVYDQNSLDEKGFWFLMLCHVMGMDVVVLEPGRDDPLFAYDLDHLSTLTRLGPARTGLTFAQREQAGKPLGKVRTTVAALSEQTDASLFGQTGVFKPWMFRGRPVHHVQLEGTRIDLEDQWDREARLREGFSAGQKEITVPSFYVEIDGVDRQRRDYLQLLDRLRKADRVLFDACRGNELFCTMPSKSEAVRLVFAMNPNGSFNVDKLREMDGFIFDKVSAETAEMIVNRLNEFIARRPGITKEERVETAAILLSMSRPLARLVENFDYPFQVPKVIIFLNREERVRKEAALMLEFLSDLGFDVAVFAPSGVSGLSDRRRSVLRLDEMVYDMDLPAPALPEREEDKGLLRSVFDLFR